MTSTTVSSRLPSLTGLRFVAAFCVLLEHLNIIAVFVPPARVAVSFFFVLSGFVLTWSSRPGDTSGSFWRRRFWKIFPNHTVSWALMLVILAVTGVSLVPGVLPPGVTPPLPAAANLTLLHSWVPSFDYMFSVNPVSWSLSSEMLFYLLFPALLPLVLRIPARRLALAAVGLVALAWLIPVVSLTFSGPQLMPGLLQSQYWFAYFFPPARLPEFVLGMVLARMVIHGFTPRLGVALTGAATLLFLFVATVTGLPAPFMFAAVTVVPVALVVLGGASMDVRHARSLWATRVMVFLGEISFALYLIHPLVNLVFNQLTQGRVRAALGDAGTNVIVIALCLVAAWVLYRTVERPLMRRFGSSRPAAAPPLETPRAQEA
ncbi:acyltransferase [Nonomuraea fuscirosea]|uniref:acyltransferase family protein n=1 Tax=Nonomuraea fuscirosea TaxID=1291556 RepID=UPI002DDA6935|nr:acyltransferase [Nonomuraea fuscirosea]WSA55929.1 acyltransferase [Nonomuraea fuscirosea]